MTSQVDEFEILSRKLNQLKLAYDQYFLGSRPREPNQLRDEINRAIIVYMNTPIQNTAMRFKFNSINSRYQAFKRQWTDTLRKIEEGTYERHRFKANLRNRSGAAASAPPEASPEPEQDRTEIYQAYVDARLGCGQSVANLTPEKLDTILEKQEAELRERYAGAPVNFRVVVEDGKAKLKASAKPR